MSLFGSTDVSPPCFKNVGPCRFFPLHGIRSLGVGESLCDHYRGTGETVPVGLEARPDSP